MRKGNNHHLLSVPLLDVNTTSNTLDEQHHHHSGNDSSSNNRRTSTTSTTSSTTGMRTGSNIRVSSPTIVNDPSTTTTSSSHVPYYYESALGSFKKDESFKHQSMATNPSTLTSSNMTITIQHYIYGFIHAICVFLTFICAIKVHPYRHISKKVKKELSLSYEYTSEIRVLRDGQIYMVGSSNLVPGDIIILNNVTTIPCDCILLSTHSHILCDESSLTGDTELSHKIPLFGNNSNNNNMNMNNGSSNKNIGQPSIDQYNVLVGGTRIVREKSTNNNTDGTTSANCNDGSNSPTTTTTNSPTITTPGTTSSPTGQHPHGELIKALVIKTGFHTVKGKIIRNILLSNARRDSNSQKTNNYMSDLLSLTYTLVILAFISIAILVLYFTTLEYHNYADRFNHRDETLYNTELDPVENSLDQFYTIVYIFMNCIPPYFTFIIVTLPMILTNRLLYKNCIKSIQSVDSSLFKFGLIDLVCYDKTGTLVESNMSIYGILTCDNLFKPTSNLKNINENVINLLSSCHNLHTKFDKDSNSNILIGDVIDQSMLEFTKYELKRSSNNLFTLIPPNIFSERGTLQVLKNYPFTSELQRQSVLVNNCTNYIVYCKGSPSIIKKLCKNIPQDYDQVVKHYGLQGFKILTMAMKIINNSDFYKNFNSINFENRNEIENNLEFIGFILLKNNMYNFVQSEIKQLEDGHFIKSKMITGDNIYTSLYTAKECGIIDSDIEQVYCAFYEDNSIEWKCLNISNNNYGKLTTLDDDEDDDDDDSNIMEYNTVKSKNKFKSIINSVSTSQNQKKIALAMTGEAFHYLRNQLISNIYHTHDELLPYYSQLLCLCHIYTEMSPNQKGNLVSDFRQYLNYIVCMIGDGSNDSIAMNCSDASLFISKQFNNSTNLINNSSKRSNYEHSYAAQFTVPLDYIIGQQSNNSSSKKKKKKSKEAPTQDYQLSNNDQSNDNSTTYYHRFQDENVTTTINTNTINNNSSNIINNNTNSHLTNKHEMKGKHIVTNLISIAQLMLDKIHINTKYILIYIYLQFIITCHDVIIYGYDISEVMSIYTHIFKGLLLPVLLSLNSVVESKSNTKYRPSKSIIRFQLLFTVLFQVVYQSCIFILILFLFHSPYIQMQQGLIFQFTNFQYLAISLSYQLTYYYRTHSLLQSIKQSLKNRTFWIVWSLLFVIDFLILCPFPAYPLDMKISDIFSITNLFTDPIANYEAYVKTGGVDYIETDLYAVQYKNYTLLKVFILCVLILNIFITFTIECLSILLYKFYKYVRNSKFKHSAITWKKCVHSFVFESENNSNDLIIPYFTTKFKTE